MNKEAMMGALKGFRASMKRHSPEILTGIGIAGMITTTVMAVRATPKALSLIEEREIEENKRLTKTEKLKTSWKCYIPSVIVGGASTACLIGGQSVNLRRNAALAAACTVSEAALKEYQEKTLEVIGEKKEQAVRDAIAKDKLEKNPVTQSQVIFTGHGDTLCFDVWSGRYFKSDIELIRRAVHELNNQMRTDNYISLNEFYSSIDLQETRPGEILGWNIEQGYIELVFSSQLAEDNTAYADTPCLVIDFKKPPQYDFNRGW